MPRANRHFLSGYIWHITQRCHRKAFLLKFAKDRARWIRWLYQAKRRYGLCVLNYTVTCNHVHLLVRDLGCGEIPPSMQLVAGRTAQEFNKRKSRRGAFWEDRYHATAVESDEHLVHCLAYIDLNMIRAGVVVRPEDWAHGGFREIQNPPSRFRIIDTAMLMNLLNVSDPEKIGQKMQRDRGIYIAQWDGEGSVLDGEPGGREYGVYRRGEGEDGSECTWPTYH